jgi:hypothetical protein
MLVEMGVGQYGSRLDDGSRRRVRDYRNQVAQMPRWWLRLSHSHQASREDEAIWFMYEIPGKEVIDRGSKYSR